MVQDNIPAVGAAGYTLLSELDDLTWDSVPSDADMATGANANTAAQGATLFNDLMRISASAPIFNHANLTAANSAAIFNEATFTTANKALVLNEAGFTTANKALVFNEAAFTTANKALVFNEAGFTTANKALLFREAGLSIVNINAIIIHANITDDNAQQILSEITKANRDLTSADNVYEILDDWNDNKLTGRDGAGTTPTGFTNLFAQKNLFRPTWTQVTGTTTPAAGKMVFNENNEEVSTPSTFNTGTWEIDFKFDSIGNSRGFYFLFMYVDATHYIRGEIYRSSGGGNYVTLKENHGAGDNSLISGPTWAGDTNEHTYKVTRDASGNFEVFIDDVAKGTVTDTNVTTSAQIRVKEYPAAVVHKFDNLKVY